jgi:hypothetical protein
MRTAWGYSLPVFRVWLSMAAVQGLAWRLLSANLLMARRKRSLCAQRKCTNFVAAGRLGDGVQPARAVTESASYALARSLETLMARAQAMQLSPH